MAPLFRAAPAGGAKLRFDARPFTPSGPSHQRAAGSSRQTAASNHLVHALLDRSTPGTRLSGVKSVAAVAAPESAELANEDQHLDSSASTPGTPRAFTAAEDATPSTSGRRSIDGSSTVASMGALDPASLLHGILVAAVVHSAAFAAASASKEASAAQAEASAAQAAIVISTPEESAAQQPAAQPVLAAASSEAGASPVELSARDLEVAQSFSAADGSEAEFDRASSSRALSIISSQSTSGHSNLRNGRPANSVSVSNLSSVKDAAGGLIKVLTRRGSALLLAVRPGEEDRLKAERATHVALKTLAVARYYAQSSVEPGAPSEDVAFVPYCRVGRNGVMDPETFGFVVMKAGVRALEDTMGRLDSITTTLKAGASSSVEGLTNRIVRQMLQTGCVAIQSAGAAASHTALRALVQAHSRLRRFFAAQVIVMASFLTEDTSSQVGHSSVFLRLDVHCCPTETYGTETSRFPLSYEERKALAEGCCC